MMVDSPLCDWQALNEDELRHQAAQYFGWASNEMSDPDGLSWRLEMQFPLSEFASVPTDWQDYFDDDVRGNPRYDEEFESAEWHDPAVISIENDEIIIWDGWHRIATSMTRGDECMMVLIGKLKAPIP